MANKTRRSFAVWIATGLGAGYFPIAPGTVGSAEGVILAVAVCRLMSPWRTLPLAVLAALLFALGVWTAGIAEKAFGRVDPGQVVIDEIAGQIITLLAAPRLTWPWLLGGFILFRAFDILKPFPARQAERLPGGWGIMVDDLVAGLYGLIALAIVGHFVR